MKVYENLAPYYDRFMNSMEKAQLAVNVIVDKKGYDIQMLDVAAITSIAEKFVICQAKNRSQSQAIADEIMDKLKAENEQPLRVEGYQGGGWILLDYGAVVVQIFKPEERAYYNLEKLWGDSPEVDITAWLAQ